MLMTTLKSQVPWEFNKYSLFSKNKVYVIPVNAIQYIDLSNFTIVLDSTQDEYIKKMIVKSNYISIENSDFFAVILPIFSSILPCQPTIYIGMNNEGYEENSSNQGPLRFMIRHLSKKEQKYWVRTLEQTPDLKMCSKASFKVLKKYPFVKQSIIQQHNKHYKIKN